MKLVIGNKRFSSWSLRPWLVMKHFNIPFAEILLPLDRPETAEQIRKYSPSGRVPVLLDRGLVIWDSLAILEHLHERFPEKGLWPTNQDWRSRARSIAHEMHSGFQELRNHMPHDLQRNEKLGEFVTEPATADIDRILNIWTECLRLSGGPYLFSSFSIADAMFAPVVNRFASYGVKVPDELQPYMTLIRELPAHREWIEAGRHEAPSVNGTKGE